MTGSADSVAPRLVMRQNMRVRSLGNKPPVNLTVTRDYGGGARNQAPNIPARAHAQQLPLCGLQLLRIPPPLTSVMGWRSCLKPLADTADSPGAEVDCRMILVSRNVRSRLCCLIFSHRTENMIQWSVVLLLHHFLFHSSCPTVSLCESPSMSLLPPFNETHLPQFSRGTLRPATWLRAGFLGSFDFYSLLTSKSQPLLNDTPLSFFYFISSL